MANRIEENLNWMKENREDLVNEAKAAFENGETRVWLVLSDSFDQNPNIWTEADREEILSNYAKYDSNASEESQEEIIARYKSDFDSDRSVIEITPDML